MAAGGPLDLNSATFDQLCSVPGVGPTLARKVIEFRQHRGRIADPDELLQVEGVTPGLLDRLRPRLTIAPPPLVARSEAPPEPAPDQEPPGPVPLDRPAGQDAEEPSAPALEPHRPAAPSEAAEQDSSRGDVEGPARAEEPPPPLEAAPVPSPGIEALFDDEEEWPRSYGGVSSAILFGEADSTPEDSPASAPQSRNSAPSLGLGRLLLLVLLSGILGAVLSLASLLTLNNTLYYVSRDQLERDFTARLDALEAEAEALSARLERTAARVANVEVEIQEVSGALQELDGDLADLGVRVAEVEGLRDQVEGTMSQVQVLTEDISALRTELDEVSASADRFGAFLEALRGALDQTTR